MDYRVKVWLEKDGQPVFGDGLLYLLSLIRQHGSIKRAAEEMRMSYRQAWGSIKKAEDRMGFKLLVKQVGGESGGGAKLTPEAHSLIERYELFRRESQEALEACFRKYFKSSEQ